jgi:hypothetical protein
MSGDGADRSTAKADPAAGAIASGMAVSAARAASHTSETGAGAVMPPSAGIPTKVAYPVRSGSVPAVHSAKVGPKRRPRPRRKQKRITKVKFSKGRREDRPIEAGVRAVRMLWGQASLLIMLIGLLSYGLGRLMVDGFYGELHTTAEAAGLGYASILEPAALFTAIVAIIGTALAAISDALLAAACWLIEHRHVFFLVLGLVALATGAVYLIAIARIDELLAFLSSVSVVAFNTLLRKFQGILGRSTGGKTRAPTNAAARSVGLRPPPSTKLQRVISVTLSIAVLAGLFFTAHEFGIHEGRQAASGKSVSITLLGFNIPSIIATVVRVQPDTSSPALDQLGKAHCLLQVGPGSSELVLYNPATKTTTTVPADQFLVSSAGATCPQ